MRVLCLCDNLTKAMRCREHMRNLSEVQLDYLICPLQTRTGLQHYRDAYSLKKIFSASLLFSKSLARIVLATSRRILLGRLAEVKPLLGAQLRELVKAIVYGEAHWNMWVEFLSRRILGRHVGSIFYLRHDVNSDQVAT